MKFIRVLTVAALFAALFVLVFPAHADCGDGDPNCLLEPPISVEIRTASTSGDASATAADSGSIAPLDFTVPMPLPRRVEAPTVSAYSEFVSTDSIPDFANLSIPMRYQTAGDVSCGVQALGMALDGINSSAPTSNSILGFLQDQGMMYDFGTGVEELAHAAQNFGYSGSLPFHGWSLDQLSATLAEGKPVVVALGANGEGEPGHFVTVTGVSPDGRWVTYNDPTLGKQVIPVEEFERLWALQGSSGVSVARAAPAGASADYAPWVALAAGLMALVSTTPMALQRKGIGGMLDPGGASSGSTGNPPYSAPAGYKWKKKIVTKYKTAWVQDGMTPENRTVPRYERQRVQVGTTTVYDKIPKYKTVRVQDGWKTVLERVPQYKTVRYVKYYRTTRRKVKRYRYVRGRRTFVGYSYVTKRTPVYGTKRIFNGYKKVTKRVPNYVEKRVSDGFKIIETEVPKYEWKDVKVGWTTEKVLVSKMVQVRQPDGVEVKWGLEKLPEPPPMLTLTPTVTPQPENYDPTPEPVAAPPATPTPTPPGTPTASSTPSAEEILSTQHEQNRCALLNCETLEQGTFIGDNPFVIDDSLGGGVPLPGIWGIIMGVMDLTNTIAGPHAYVEYVNNQEDNVAAQLTYSLDTNGKIIEQVGIQNNSGQFLKVIVNVQNSNGTITQVGPEWVNSGSATIDIYHAITTELGSEESIFIKEGGTGSVKVTIVANFNDPPLLTGMEFTIPAEQ